MTEKNDEGQEKDPNTSQDADSKNPNPSGDQTEETPEQELARLRNENAEYKGKADHWKKKHDRVTTALEDPDDENPEDKGSKSEEQEKDLSSAELMAVMQANVPAEDLSELRTLAKAYNLPIDKALQNQTIKDVLTNRQKERDVALANDTSGGGSKPKNNLSGDAIVRKREKTGEGPSLKGDEVEKEFLAEKGITE